METIIEKTLLQRFLSLHIIIVCNYMRRELASDDEPIHDPVHTKRSHDTELSEEWRDARRKNDKREILIMIGRLMLVTIIYVESRELHCYAALINEARKAASSCVQNHQIEKTNFSLIGTGHSLKSLAPTFRFVVLEIILIRVSDDVNQ